MKIFLDTANLNEICEAKSMGLLDPCDRSSEGRRGYRDNALQGV